MWHFFQSFIWHERIEPGRTTVTGCSDGYFTVTAAWYVGVIGACHVLFLPCVVQIEWVIYATTALVGMVLLLAFFDRFHLEIGPAGYRLRSYWFGVLRHDDVCLPADTRFNLFDPDWDPEASHFAIGFFQRRDLKTITWLYCFQAGLAEERLLCSAKQHGLIASEPESQHEST